MSSEPAEMARFIAVIRDLETALGSPRRMMTPAEVERRNANRRSIHPRRAMAAGDTLAFEDLDFRRPGYGIAPTETDRSEEHTSELQSLMRISYAVFCLKKTTHN